jgi:polymorphic toxin system nucleotidyltransferase-like protein
MPEPSVPQAFRAALDALMREVQKDKSILAAILCGSLAHDTVWARSDIDLVLVTIDDQKVKLSDLPLYADGVNVHAMLIPRTDFRKTVEGSIHNSFMHSFLAKGKLLYTHDETIAALCARLQSMGSRDATIQMLSSATGVLPSLYKARKWMLTRGDCAYTALWLLYAAMPLARMEVIGAGLLADREVIPQAMKLNPSLFKTIYLELLRDGTSKATVMTALETMEAYMAACAPRVFAPVIEYLQEVGDVRSSRDIEDHFKRNFGISGATCVCEYLADLGLVGKASTPVMLTKRSNTSVQELAFFFSGPPDGE